MVRPAALARAPHAPVGGALLSLPDRYPLLARLARFGLTGGAAGLTQLLLLVLLTGRSLPALMANAVAFVLAAQINFWLSQTFTWHDRRSAPGVRGLTVRWLRFHGAIAGTALVNMAVFAVASAYLPYLSAATLGIGVAATANFIVGDRFVFRRAGVAEREPAAESRGGDSSADLTPLPGQDGTASPAHGGSELALARRWGWAGLAGVVMLAAVLYGWGLSRNGYANEYYAAAAFSMSQSWHSFFYGAIDSIGFITVDKPPFALWIQALSVRLFGLSSWSILLPQAVAALGTLVAVCLMARRQFGATAAMLAGLILALTPITVAVARVNLPDTVLIALLTLGAWATLVAIRSGRLGPLLLAMVCVGLGFNTKMLQAFVVVPAFVGTYLLVAPGSLWRRLAHLSVAGVVLLAVSASWLTVVDSVPADRRPYIGGSSNNTVLDLALGYNGLGRIFGQGLARGASPAEVVARLASALLPSSGSDAAADSGAAGARTAPASQPAAGPGGPGGPGGGGPGFGGQAGWLRLFNNQIGGQIGWLLPLAGVSLAAGLLACWGRPRTDSARAWYLLWGGWLVTHVVVFSFAEGIFHPYYTSALGPAVAALCGPGLLTLWQAFRQRWWLTWALPGALAGTAAVGFILVSRSQWLPWLAPAIVATVGLGILVLLLGRLIRRPIGGRIAMAGLALGIVGILAGPAAWATTPLTSTGMAVNPQAGPMDSFGFGRGGPGGPGSPGRGPSPGPAPHAGADGQASGLPAFGAPPVVSGQPGVGIGISGQVPGPDGIPQDGGRAPVWFGGGSVWSAPDVAPASAPDDAANPQLPVAQAGPPPGGPPGGPMGPGGRVDANLIAYLEQHREPGQYLVAVNSSMAASPIILQTGAPVMAMGGFSGGDPAPTAEHLAQMVAEGKVRFVMGSGRAVGGPGRGPGGGVSSERGAWVQANCVAVDPSTYGGQSEAPSESGTGGRGFGAGGRGGDQLYDCAPVPTAVSDQPGG